MSARRNGTAAFMDRSGLDDKSAPFQGEAKGFAGRGLLGGNPGHLHTGRSQEGQAIDKTGPVVALTNSAGGWRVLLSALKAKGAKMKGIVAYETPGFVFPEGEGASSETFMLAFQAAVLLAPGNRFSR